MWEIIMWIFVIYGVLKLIQDIFDLINIKRILEGEIQVVLRVCNQQEKIQHIVEKIINDLPEAKIKIEDAGSYDNTYSILMKLEHENDNLYVTKM